MCVVLRHYFLVLATFGTYLLLLGTIEAKYMIGECDFLLIALRAAPTQNLNMHGPYTYDWKGTHIDDTRGLTDTSDMTRGVNRERVPFARHGPRLVLSVLFFPLDNVVTLLTQPNICL